MRCPSASSPNYRFAVNRCSARTCGLSCSGAAGRRWARRRTVRASRRRVGSRRRERLRYEACRATGDEESSVRRERNLLPLHSANRGRARAGPSGGRAAVRNPARSPAVGSASRSARVSLSTSATALAKSCSARPSARLRMVGEASNGRLHIQPRDRSFYHVRRPAEAAVTAGWSRLRSHRGCFTVALSLRAERESTGTNLDLASAALAMTIAWTFPPAPADLSPIPRPRRCATAPCAAVGEVPPRNAVPSSRPGVTRRCRRSAAATHGRRSSASRRASTALIAPGEPFTGDYAGEPLDATLPQVRPG